MKATPLTHNGQTFSVSRKNIKHLYLRFYPQEQRFAVSAPRHLSDGEIRAFIDNRQDWIAQQKQRPVPTTLTYQTGDTVFYLGHSLTLCCHPADQRAAKKEGSLLHLTHKEGDTLSQREEIYWQWQREQLQQVVPPRLAFWEEQLGLYANQWRIRRMSTRWGSCNPAAGRIWVALALVERPLFCIDYLLVHELCHLAHPHHGPAFWEQVESVFPRWQEARHQLNTPAT